MAELIVVDASVLIAWLDERDVHHEEAIDTLASVERFVVHPLTLAEVLVQGLGPFSTTSGRRHHPAESERQLLQPCLDRVQTGTRMGLDQFDRATPGQVERDPRVHRPQRLPLDGRRLELHDSRAAR